MRTTTITTAIAAAAIGLSACGGDSTGTTTTAASPAAAVTITDPWVRTTAPAAMAGAAYMTIAVQDQDALTGVSVPASVAGEAQMHEATGGGHSTHDAGGTAPMTAMKGMRRVHRIEIAAGHTVRLAPGGYHIMLMRLAAPVTAGQKIPITLTFEHAGKLTVDAVARDR